MKTIYKENLNYNFFPFLFLKRVSLFTSLITMLLITGCTKDDNIEYESSSVNELEGEIEKALAFQIIKISDDEGNLFQTMKFSAISLGRIKNHLNFISHNITVDGKKLSNIFIVNEFEGTILNPENEDLLRSYEKDIDLVSFEHLENNFVNMKPEFRVEQKINPDFSSKTYDLKLEHKFPKGRLNAWVQWKNNSNVNNGLDCRWQRKYNSISGWINSGTQSIHSGNTIASYDYKWGGKKRSRIAVKVYGNYYNFSYGSY